MTYPLLSVYGLETNSKYYVKHYQQVPNLYPNTSVIALPTRSVMTPKVEIDFWNSDADVVYTEDSLSYSTLFGLSRNYFDYFKGFPKVFRIANGIYPKLGNEFSLEKSALQLLNIATNLNYADIVWASSTAAARRCCPR